MKRLVEVWRRFAHDRLAWGYPASARTFDGCSFGAVCMRCDRALLQDSQGNWFHLSRVAPDPLDAVTLARGEEGG